MRVIFFLLISVYSFGQQVLPNRDGVVFSNNQVREIARVIQTNEALNNEVNLYKKLVGQQDTLGHYSDLQIERMDSVIVSIDKKFGIVFKEYNKLSIEFLEIERKNNQLTNKNNKLTSDNKKLKRRVWVQRIVGILGLTAVIIFN